MDVMLNSLAGYGWLAVFLALVVAVLLIKRIGRAFGGDVVEVSAEQAAQLLEQQQATLIDLAEKTTFEKGHIPQAINMPGVSFIDGSAALEDASQAIILVPMKGLIPMPVVQYLDSCKVPQVYILKGGTKAWQEAGLPM